MKTHKLFCLSAILTGALALVGCGSGTGSGDSSGNRTTGVVTNTTPASLTVASTTFSTSGSAVSGDEISSLEQVQVGMMVSVESDGSGNALSVDYDAEVEGVVDSIGSGAMVVMGQTVDISQNPTFVSEMPAVTDISNIPVGAMVEVSGYSDGMGNIVATYVKLEDHMADESDEMELEGIIHTLDTVGGTFMIGDQVIHYDPNSIDLTLENGLNVEVDINMDSSGDLHATEVEIEDDYGDEHEEGHSIEIEGMVTAGLGTDGTFSINGETVILGDVVEYKDGLSAADIVDGAHLKVEGHLNADGVLVITEVELPGMS